MFNKKSYNKNSYMLNGKYNKKGYDWWWHSFTAYNAITKEEKTFFIEFFIINPKLHKDSISFGDFDSKNTLPSYLMIKCGAWGENKAQLHRFFPLSEVKITKKPQIKIEADDCFLSETKLKGSVDVSEKRYGSDIGSMSFDLEIAKDIAFNVGYGTSCIFRALKVFEMYWHAEGMKSFYSGSITYNGVQYNVIPDKSFGYADKNWGCDFTSPWVWLSSNNLTSNVTKKKLDNSVFDIGGGCPKIFGIPLKRKLLGAFYYEGKEYEFNFSKFWTKTKTEFSFNKSDDTVYWEIIMTNRHSKMITNITCKKADMLFIRYEAPDGKSRHKILFNGGNGVGNILLYKKNKKNYELIDDISVSNTGCEYGEY